MLSLATLAVSVLAFSVVLVRLAALGAILVCATPVGCADGPEAKSSLPPATPFPTGTTLDRTATARALGRVSFSECARPAGPTGSGHLRITFSPDGTVQSAVVDQPPFAGTSVGRCIAEAFVTSTSPRSPAARLQSVSLSS